MIRQTISTTLFVGGTKYNTVPGLSRDVCRIRKIRYYNIQFGKMTKSVTYEATGGCVTYYGALDRNQQVLWVRYIPNGSLWTQVKTAFGRIPTFSL